MKRILSFISDINLVWIVPLVLFIYIFGSNMNVIMTKFGFETTTSLKAELVELQGRYDNLKIENKNLKDKIKLKDHLAEIELTINDWYENNNYDVDKTVKDILDQINIKPIVIDIENEINIEPDIKSLENIEMIHLAYNKLFGGNT